MARRKPKIAVKLSRADVIEFLEQLGLYPDLGVGRQFLQLWDAQEEANKADRREGKRRDRARNGYAGYGFTWRGRSGRKRRVESKREMKTIAWIVRYRRDGYSWRELHDHLAENAVLTAKGKPWSVMRVRRAYRAATEAGRAPRPENGKDDEQNSATTSGEAATGTGQEPREPVTSR
jgi:hypothetical protein